MKLWEYKNYYFIQQFIFFSVNLQCTFMTVPRHLRVHSYAPASAASHACVVILLWMAEDRREELLNKVIIFVFFVHKKFSLGFIKLRLNRWCHIDYFNNVLTTFLALKVLVVLLSMEGQKALGFHQKYLNLCSEDERRSCHMGVSNYWPNFSFLCELSL